MPPETLDVTVQSICSLTPRVKQFMLTADGHEFEFEPGQHVSVAIDGEDGGTPEYRPYSPVSKPGTDTIAIAVKRYAGGAGSTWMHERSVGDTISITPASGNLHLNAPKRDAIFLCTGTGLTPMLSMATQYLDEGEGDANLLFGERTQEDLMYQNLLDLYTASHPNFSAEYVLSDEDWAGRTGYVQDHLSDVIDDVAGPQFYVCGVPEMVVDTKNALRELGVPGDHIFSEGWEEGAIDE